MKDLHKRVITGVIGILALILIMYLGIEAIKIFFFIVTLEAIREIYNALIKKGITLFLPTLFFGSVITFVVSFFELNILFAPIAFFIINSICTIIVDDYSLNNSIYTFFAYFYSVFLLTLLAISNDIMLIISAFVVSFSTDTFAYFIGSIFGKHKLIERVSPNKSVEGAIGGTFSATIITTIYFYYISKNFVNIHINFYVVLIIILASVAGQFGDLFASYLKRYTGIKDYANILPGHGGVLDRFDSIIFVSPFIYVLFHIL
ncbi:phosphatidate cytidylyltransferase [Peptoniphilus olsenii]|uniref:Phosphatidate cytidylyltransferase n=1 Tax=Peptoniphilus olsenii TaxID=411570 RepID=A0ABV2J6W0_9FIRM